MENNGAPNQPCRLAGADGPSATFGIGTWAEKTLNQPSRYKGRPPMKWDDVLNQFAVHDFGQK